MDIHLSPEAEEFIESQLQQGLRASPEEVIEALIQEKRSNSAQSVQTLELEALAESQLQKFMEVVRKCESLPAKSKRSGFSNRDHDKVLYGTRE